MSRGEQESGRGKMLASSGKFRMAVFPLMQRAATSCARAAISGSENVPSQIRDFFLGSRISETHFPHARIRTPRFSLCYLLFFTTSAGIRARFLFKMPPKRREGEESDYPFFEGDGSSSDEWRDYDMAYDDYEGPLVFDDDQYEEELMPVYDTAIEYVIEEEEGFVKK
nr:hypothetical protein [Tanacetum cinerariifolium]